MIVKPVILAYDVLMEEIQQFPPEMKKFLEEFILPSPNATNLQKGNDRVMSSALWYEKFRRAVEYQEDHLIFKNAIARIAKRRHTFSISPTVEEMFDGIMSELAWADYLNLDSLKDEQVEKIKEIIGRYLEVLKYSRTRSLDADITKTVFSWMACEIDELLFGRHNQELLIDFTYSCLKDNLKHYSPNHHPKEQEIQLKLAILTLIFKPDYSYAQFWLIQKMFPDFKNFSLERAREIGFHFDNIVEQVQKIFKNKYSKDYLSYTKKHIAPFILIKELPNHPANLQDLPNDPLKFSNALMNIYDALLKQTQEKVWRGTIRALIFIVLTKISLAFLIEMPYDQYIAGAINYLPLMVNIGLPPILMLFAGLSVKTPPINNRQMIHNAINNLIVYQKIDSKPFYIGLKRKSSLDIFFNSLYIAFNMAIIFAVIALLRKIGFNIVSISLFFIFVSAVSFFAFRIRNIALELMIQTHKDNFIVSVVEFVFLPFILIGKMLSAALTHSNPFTITLDFLIEAPLKSILKIINSWLKFISQKKEDLDI